MERGSSSEKGPKNKSISTSWGKVASWYDEHLEGEDTYHQKVLLPGVMRLVAPKPGMTVLDLACGQGFFDASIIEVGAKVVGVDVAPELIAIAKKKAPNAEYHVSPSHDLSMIEGGSIDAAVCVLAAQNIEKWPQTMKELARVVRLGGSFTLVLNHPAFRIPKRSSWGFDDREGVQYRRLDGYLSESRTQIDMHPGEARKVTTISFHRPLQWYAKHLTNDGFVIDRLEEWTSHKTSVGKRGKAENAARKEFPLFLALRSIKRTDLF